MTGDRALWAQLLELMYTLAHRLGQALVFLLQQVLPQLRSAADLADPLGVVALLTIAVVLTQVAGKIMWFVVAVGWFLIAIRIVLAVAGVGSVR
jgi:hypothetical protein